MPIATSHRPFSSSEIERFHNNATPDTPLFDLSSSTSASDDGDACLPPVPRRNKRMFCGSDDEDCDEKRGDDTKEIRRLQGDLLPYTAPRALGAFSTPPRSPNPAHPSLGDIGLVASFGVAYRRRVTKTDLTRWFNAVPKNSIVRPLFLPVDLMTDCLFPSDVPDALGRDRTVAPKRRVLLPWSAIMRDAPESRWREFSASPRSSISLGTTITSCGMPTSLFKQSEHRRTDHANGADDHPWPRCYILFILALLTSFRSVAICTTAHRPCIFAS